jgi:hypothetical protein
MLCNTYDDMASFSYYNTRGVTVPDLGETDLALYREGGGGNGGGDGMF